MVVRLGQPSLQSDSLALHRVFSLPLELGIDGHTQVVIISTVGWLSCVLRDIDEMHTHIHSNCLTSHPTPPTPSTPTHHRLEETGAEVRTIWLAGLAKDIPHAER